MHAFALRHRLAIVLVVTGFVTTAGVFTFARPQYHPRYESEMIDLSEPTRFRSSSPREPAKAAGDVSAIQRAWAHFEGVVGLKGRKFFGVFDSTTREYRVCAQLREDDDPEQLGLEIGTLPGGRYLRARLTGEPPAVYDEIAPTVQRLASQAAVDASRPTIEFYRSRDVIDLLLPIT